MSSNGLTDEQYAANRLWLEQQFVAYPYACWVFSSVTKCFQHSRSPKRCLALASPGIEVYMYASEQDRDDTMARAIRAGDNYIYGLPPIMVACPPVANSPGASAPKKVDFSTITREIVGRG